MPFDPDAYLATKQPAATGGGFDPDAYLASKRSATLAAPAPGKPPVDTRSDTRRLWDQSNMPGDMLGSAVRSTVAAPIANMAGLARTAWEGIVHGSKGDGDAPIETKRDVQNTIAPPMDNPEVRKLMAPVGAVIAPIGSALHAGAEALRGDGPANSPRAMAANAVVEGIKQASGFIGLKGAPAVGRIAENVSGKAATAARSDAIGATRTALGDVEAAHGRTQATAMTEAQSYEDAAARTQRHLDVIRRRKGVPTADAIGEDLRGSYVTLMDQAKAARKAATDPLYAKAQEAAAARESTGARVDIKPAVADIKRMLALSENLPDLQAKLQRLREAVEGSTPKQPVPAPIGKVVQAKAARVATPPAPGLTYDQLALANRYIKDIAFAGEAEGYSATIRNTAKKLSMDLDRQISAFVPEHDAAQAAYRKLSEPMETLSTKIGGALYDTEGGLKGESYAKVSAQDLPSRIFGKRDRIEQLVDALSGGQQATPAARAAAQARVDTWVENWVLDAKRGKVGDAARVDAPGQRAALQAAPGAAQRLERTWGAEQAQAGRIPELRQAADAARKQGYEAALAKQKISSLIERADIDLAHGSAKDAFNGYKEVLRANLALTDRARYKAAIELIDRAATQEQRLVLARRLAKGLAAAAGVGAAYKLGVQVPGMMQ